MIADHHNVSADRLRNVYLRMKKHPDREHGKNIFSWKEEDMILATIRAHDLAQRPLSRSFVLDLASRMRTGVNEWNPDGWYQRFFSRHKDQLAMLKHSELSASRSAPQTYDYVVQWVNRCSALFEQRGLSPEGFCNADETRLSISKEEGKQTFLVMKASAKELESGAKRQSRARKKSLFASLVPFFHASGDVLLLLYILPSDPTRKYANIDIVERMGRNKSIYPVYYGFSKTGFMSKGHWFNIVKKFKQVWDLHHPGLRPVLFLDNLAAHRTDEVIDLYVELGIDAIYFVPNTTHFSQPADDTIFAVFKNSILNELKKRKAFLNKKSIPLGDAIFRLAQNKEGLFTKAVVQAAFRNTGIYPWNRELILDRAARNVGEVDIVPSNTSLDESAFLAVLKDVISDYAGEEEVNRVEVLQTPDKVYDSTTLHKNRKKAELEREKEKMARKRAKTLKQHKAREKKRDQWQKRCRGVHSEHDEKKKKIYHRGGKGWEACKCGFFYVCGPCNKADPSIMQDHLDNHDAFLEDDDSFSEEFPDEIEY